MQAQSPICSGVSAGGTRREGARTYLEERVAVVEEADEKRSAVAPECLGVRTKLHTHFMENAWWMRQSMPEQGF
jgi:hypothetical protein